MSSSSNTGEGLAQGQPFRATDFTKFSSLSAELQMEIWEHAHAEHCAWEVDRVPNSEEKPAYTFYYVGPVSSEVRLASHDADRAWRHMRTKARPSRLPIRIEPSKGYDMGTKVIYFNDIREVPGFTETYDRAFLSRLVHIGIAPGRHMEIGRALSALYKTCPATQSVSIGWLNAGMDFDIGQFQKRPLTPGHADVFLCLARRHGPEYVSPGFDDRSGVGTGFVDVRYYKNLFRSFFEDWPPKINSFGPFRPGDEILV